MTLLLSLLLLVPFSEVLLEAEDADLFGVEVATVRDGFSGTGYVGGTSNEADSLRFTFEVESGVYELWLGVAVTGRSASLNLRLDGTSESRNMLGTGGAFADRKIRDVWLNAGTHTIVLQGPMDIDYLRLTPVQHQGPPRPTHALSDPDATPSTRALHGFLLDVYGTHLLAGQQDMNEIQYIENVTGRTVAVGAFDLIEYSPSRVACGANPGRAAENWIEWAGEDALVTLAWHWNAPTDLIDDDCNDTNQPRDLSWWRGFYTVATTFNFADALADTTSERYQLILRDVDAIAVQLRKFADADIPVLWRPLHEAAGGWFWWGARGAAPFVDLWRLMYDRLVHHHQLHNLIWVYTHEPNAFDWYPGDAYVDIVSRDVYAADHSVTMMGDWEQLMDAYGERKLIALSESGTLPRPEHITPYGIWWSWFALWNGDFVRGIEPDYLSEVFNSDLVITRDELPNWRSIYSSSQAPPRPKAFSLTVYPNPTSGSATLDAQLPTASPVQIEVVDATGRRLIHEVLGHQPAGTVTRRITLPDAAGVYLIRLTAGDRSAARTVVVVP